MREDSFLEDDFYFDLMYFIDDLEISDDVACYYNADIRVTLIVMRFYIFVVALR